jgi:hypothetical protein
MTSEELFYFFLSVPSFYPHSCIEITPSDSNDQPAVFNGIYVGDISGGSDVVVRTLEGNTVTFNNVIAGQKIETGYIDRVLSTGTSATSLIGFYYVTAKKPA